MISLIMPTLNRFDDIELFFDSLIKQTYKDFEVIVVDQNECNKVETIVNKYKNILNIVYIKSDKKGISYNRNIGISKASGEIIAFPDDDCKYKYDTLEKVSIFFNNNPDYKIYSCKTMDDNEIDMFKRMFPYDCDINSKNVLETVLSITFFVNFKYDEYIFFDERLGVGAEYGAGEETDYVLELLNRGFKGRYFSNDIVYHPVKSSKNSKEKFERDFNYGRGFGALCKKQIVYRSDKLFIIVMLKKIIRNIGGILLSKNKDYHIATIKGRIDGFRKYKTEDNC